MQSVLFFSSFFLSLLRNDEPTTYRLYRNCTSAIIMEVLINAIIVEVGPLSVLKEWARSVSFGRYCACVWLSRNKFFIQIGLMAAVSFRLKDWGAYNIVIFMLVTPLTDVSWHCHLKRTTPNRFSSRINVTTLTLVWYWVCLEMSGPGLKWVD